MSQDKPFDRSLRRLRRSRAVARFRQADFLHKRAAEELLERLSLVRRQFRDVLVLGALEGSLADALAEGGATVIAADPAPLHSAVQCDEDRLPFGDGSFDLILSLGTLDTVNDLPGALTLIRRTLRPDGLFMAAFAGAGSLPSLRRAMFEADAWQGRASPRVHPQIDVRAAGDLLTRAGFAIQVADTDSVDVRYTSFRQLVSDLRAMSGTNILSERSKEPLGRYALAAAEATFRSLAGGDGKTAERFEIIYLTGWAPSPDQAKPARRGSATASLAAALRPPSR